VRILPERERALAEAAALRVLEGTRVPAPRLLWSGRARELGWSVVSTRVPGRLTARPDDGAWLGRLTDVLLEVHRIPPRGRGLQRDPGAQRAWLASRTPLDLGPLGEEVRALLRRRRNELALGEPALAHFDFHPGNVHWARGRVAGVIDWELARWAPPTADVAYLYMDLALAAGRRAANRFLAGYVARGGQVSGFDAWLLLACLRPLPDPAGWLPSWEAAGYRGLTAPVVRRRLRALVRSLA